MEQKQVVDSSYSASACISVIESDSEYNEKDYVDGCIFSLNPGINWVKDRANIILTGQTRSGKTTLLHNIIQKCLLKELDPRYIYIFSKTAKIDMSYRPLIMYLIKNTMGKLKIYDTIDMEVIKNIVEGQKTLQLQNMSVSKEERIPIKNVLLIYDDIIGDDQLKSYQSDLCAFSCMSRHANIINIYLTQNYTSIPSVIRRNANLVVLLTSDNYSASMIEENALKNKHKQFAQFYEDNIINQKDHSFLIIDKSAKIDNRYVLYNGTKGSAEYVNPF